MFRLGQRTVIPGPQLAAASVPGSIRHWRIRTPAGSFRSAKTEVLAGVTISPGLPSCVNVEFFYLLLLCMTALTVVLMVTVVGIVMTIALLPLPAAIASQYAKSLWQMMLVSAGLCMVFTVTGLGISYGPYLPAGATIVVIAGATYLLSTILTTVLRGRRDKKVLPPENIPGGEAKA